MISVKNTLLLFILIFVAACNNDSFEEFNTNPNEPTSVSPDVLLTGAIRKSVNTTVDASFLAGNVAAQLTAKTLRLEVDAYDWNAFPNYWEGWYESLTDIHSLEAIAITEENENLEGAAIVLRCWIFANLTNAYGNIPYSEAIQGAGENFTPVYDDQQAIYEDLLSELRRAEALLSAENGSIPGDILLEGDVERWRRFANSLRLRLLMYAGDNLDDAANRFATIVNDGNIISGNGDNVTLTYTGSAPNEFPVIPLKIGDFDAVALSASSYTVMSAYNDPRLLRYARPDNEDFEVSPVFTGRVNGIGEGCGMAAGSRLGVQYYDYPDLTTADALGLPAAEGIVMTYAEVLFLLAEAAATGWIGGDAETYYREGIEASMEYNMVDLAPFGWMDFNDFYDNSGVAYTMLTDIWEQKWLALYFHGLEPYFEVRRWYHESGDSFDGIPFLEAACGNLNNDMLPLRFLYPGEEQSLNSVNYQAAVDALGGSNSQNAAMWLVQ